MIVGFYVPRKMRYVSQAAKELRLIFTDSGAAVSDIGILHHLFHHAHQHLLYAGFSFFLFLNHRRSPSTPLNLANDIFGCRRTILLYVPGVNSQGIGAGAIVTVKVA